MNAPEKLVLKMAGDEAIIRVQSCQKATVGKYPEYEFVGTNAQGRLCLIVVPQASVARQLVRMEESVDSIIGKTLRFSRDVNPVDQTKPFWGITLAEAALPVPAAAPSAPSPAPTNGEAKEAKESGAALYAKITDYVLGTILEKYSDAGIPITMEGTAAIVATLYISASRAA